MRAGRGASGALICYERLSSMDPTSPDYRWGLAVSLEAVGQNKRAAAILAELAPADRPGYAPPSSGRPAACCADRTSAAKPSRRPNVICRGSCTINRIRPKPTP